MDHDDSFQQKSISREGYGLTLAFRCRTWREGGPLCAASYPITGHTLWEREKSHVYPHNLATLPFPEILLSSVDWRDRRGKDALHGTKITTVISDSRNGWEVAYQFSSLFQDTVWHVWAMDDFTMTTTGMCPRCRSSRVGRAGWSISQSVRAIEGTSPPNSRNAVW